MQILGTALHSLINVMEMRWREIYAKLGKAVREDSVPVGRRAWGGGRGVVESPT